MARDVIKEVLSDETPIDLRAPRDLMVHADRTRVHQALEIVLADAIQSSPPGMPLVLTLDTEVRDDTAWAVVNIRDEVPGVASDVLPGIAHLCYL